MTNFKVSANITKNKLKGFLTSKNSDLYIWVYFLVVSFWLILLNTVFQKDAPGDLNLYNLWMWKGINLNIWPIINEPFVYPPFAIVPMLINEILSNGSNDLYTYFWLISSVLCNAIALRYILYYKFKKSESKSFNALIKDKNFTLYRKSAAVYWITFMLFMGPVYLSRIDIFQISLAVIAIIFIYTREEISSILITFAAWIKVFSGAFIVPILLTTKKWFKKCILPCFVVSAAITLIFLALSGSLSNVLSFLTSQTDRSLQIESPAANIFIIQELISGHSTLYFNNQLLTNELGANMAKFVASKLDLIMIVFVLLICFLIFRCRKLEKSYVVSYGGLAISIALILFNKVGSPQYYAILPIGVIGLIFYNCKKIEPDVVLTLLISLFTWFLYPTTYSAFLNFANPLHPLSVFIITIRNALLVILFIRVLYKLFTLKKLEQLEIEK